METKPTRPAVFKPILALVAVLAVGAGATAFAIRSLDAPDAVAVAETPVPRATTPSTARPVQGARTSETVVAPLPHELTAHPTAYPDDDEPPPSPSSDPSASPRRRRMIEGY